MFTSTQEEIKMKFKLSSSHNVTASKRTIEMFKGTEFAYAKFNYKTYKNVRRLKTLASVFNRYMNKMVEDGILKEYQTENEFEMFV